MFDYQSVDDVNMVIFVLLVSEIFEDVTIVTTLRNYNHVLHFIDETINRLTDRKEAVENKCWVDGCLVSWQLAVNITRTILVLLL